MANVKIDAAKLPTLFDEKRRPSEQVTDMEDLKLEGQTFTSYSPKAGTTYRFPKFEEAIIKKQPVTEGGTAMQYLIGCESSNDGKNFTPDWFSLNHLNKRTAPTNAYPGGEPVHPTWAALGNVYERAKKLCEMGEIKASDKARTIQVTAFDNGKRVFVPARDENGQLIGDENGEPTMVLKTNPQEVYDLTPVA